MAAQTISPEKQERIIEQWNKFPFFSWAGLEIIEAQNGKARIILHVQPHHRGGGGTDAINGGIMAYLFDGLLGTAAYSVWDEAVTGQVTVSLNVQFVGMLRAKSQVEGRAEVVRQGKTTLFIDGEILDEAGEVCARCQGIFRLRRKRSAS